MPEVVRTFQTPDGKRRLSILALENGLFSFDEQLEARLDNPHLAEADQAYWQIIHESGLYESLEAAEQEARTMTPWLSSTGESAR